MKHHILVYLVEPSTTEPALIQAWRVLLGNNLHNNVTPAVRKGRIGENVWLLDRENDASVLAKIVFEAEKFHIEYKVLFLSSE